MLTHSALPYSDVEDIAKEILDRTACRPKLGIICGSGLGGLAESVENADVIDYSEITGFPVSTGRYMQKLTIHTTKTL